MNFEIIRDKQGNITQIKTNLTGNNLLKDFRINKNTGFSPKERSEFGLLGLIPNREETIEEQAARCYLQCKAQPSKLAQFIYLNALHAENETLFYKVINDNLQELLPIVYTPTIGEAVEKFSTEYRQPQGLFLSYPNKDNLEAILAPHLTENIDMVLVTDGEGVLGIGDQGVGAINISIGKLAVYTLCAGINPWRVLPVQLDVGTDNEILLNDPLYVGWRHPRVKGKDYDDFIDAFVKTIQKKLPNVFLHWEDFGRDTARKNLDRYRNKMCTFNDDMQGTGVVTLSAVLSGIYALGQKLTDQRFIFFGAGTSSSGIADQICDAMVLEGLSLEEARNRIWMLGKRGLLTKNLTGLLDFQEVYSHSKQDIANWQVEDSNRISLLETVKNVKPTVMIGVSTVSGAFSEEVVREMAKYVEHPIILPLSNPTSKAEAVPADLLRWTNNKALVATGSPFPDVEINGKKMRVAQCNNAFAFPGIGLGLIAGKTRRVTNGMIWAACKALTDFSPVKKDRNAPLLPSLAEVKDVSHHIAKAVINQAIADGVADPVSDIDLAIRSVAWEPKYYPLVKG